VSGRDSRGSLLAQGIGYLFTNILPLRVGEPARVIVLSGRCRLPLVQVAASALVERLLDVATVVGALVLILPWMSVPVLVVRAGTSFGVVVLMGLLGLWLLVRYRQVGERLLSSLLKRIPRPPAETILARRGERIEGLALLTRFQTAWRSVVWSACTWALSIGLYLCVLQAFRKDSTAVEATFMVVALSLARRCPPDRASSASVNSRDSRRSCSPSAASTTRARRWPPPWERIWSTTGSHHSWGPSGYGARANRSAASAGSC